MVSTLGPVARALTGYLLVRGGVHQVAYARAVENLTGANLMKLFPAPRIPTETIPECRPQDPDGLADLLLQLLRPPDVGERLKLGRREQIAIFSTEGELPRDLDGPCWDRTSDLGIKSPLLYRLS